ncbi:hypothetical protein GN244_ATG15855 [Phytophthora infestans]|uniref:WRKY19-like zinc finger domain-containing protein n=1 Tax=Phytophthora infestans TaxID=4787 RepID=A0A833SIV9_PHYIN|nr:hypothetical protein GN244_ATG15855 [Phytophthora infestans]KAF4147200.1 hypothetical protein GN958_ATG03610 [Phytophthora infestans]
MTSLALPPLTVFTNFAPSPRGGSPRDMAATPTTPAAGTPKFSLAFILDDNTMLESPVSAYASPDPVSEQTKLSSPKQQRRSLKRKLTANEKRTARQCCIEGCSNYTIDRGLCFRHGGGKSCSKSGCTASAKHRGLCWKHGGSTLCTVERCTRGAKSRGLCWSHGGGTKCSVANCQKTTISKGLCWTHGGGKRCALDGCKRPASQSKQNYCVKHQPDKTGSNYLSRAQKLVNA